MKQLIVLISMVLLGLYLFGLIAGPQDGSVYSSVRQLWQQEIQQRTMES